MVLLFGEIKRQRRIKPVKYFFPTSLMCCLVATDMGIYYIIIFFLMDLSAYRLLCTLLERENGTITLL